MFCFIYIICIATPSVQKSYKIISFSLIYVIVVYVLYFAFMLWLPAAKYEFLYSFIGFMESEFF